MLVCNGKGKHSPDNREGDAVQTKLDQISRKAKEENKCRFNNLMHLLNPDNLKECFYLLKKNASAGSDGVSFVEYESKLEDNLVNLVDRMKCWSYRPQPVRRIYIPKSNGKTRPLGIPSIEDKIVQMAVTRILNAIYENDFTDFSYGFRPDKCCHDALERLDLMIKWNPVSYVIDADIKGFFDNMDHQWMIKMLEERIADKNLLRLIKRFLRNGYLEDGKYYSTEQGTPQGGVISPILSNIYLHYVIDLWMRDVVKKRTQGFVGIVRYADDYVICVGNKSEAEKILQALKRRLSKFNLDLAEDKTKLICFGRFAESKARRTGKRTETFDFLSFTHYNSKDRKGGFRVGRKTARKKFSVKLEGMYQWLKKSRGIKPQLWWKILCAKLRGHYNYYGVSGNYREIEKYYQLTIKYLYKWLNRRSQKRSFNWDKFRVYLERFPLPKPRIYHNLYQNRSYRGEC
jgi:RNA-directed DNA polymerase